MSIPYTCQHATAYPIAGQMAGDSPEQGKCVTLVTNLANQKAFSPHPARNDTR